MTRAWTVLVAAGLASALCTLSPATAHPADEQDHPSGDSLPLLGELLPPLVTTEPPPPAPPTGQPESARKPVGAPVLPIAPDPVPGPGRQWSLTATSVVLHAPRLHGVTTTEVAGRPVQVLRITTDGVDLTAPVQRAQLPNRAVLRISARTGRIRPARNGAPVEIFVRQMSGTLAVAGHPVVPVLLAAPPLAAEVDPALLQLPKLVLTGTTLHATELTSANLAFSGTEVGVE